MQGDDRPVDNGPEGEVQHRLGDEAVLHGLVDDDGVPQGREVRIGDRRQQRLDSIFIPRNLALKLLACFAAWKDVALPVERGSC